MLEEPLINGIMRRGRALRMADAVSSEPFHAWAGGAGLGFDPRYPDAQCLGLLPPRDSARFWVLPAAPRAWPHFAGSILKSLDRWETGYLWPRSGQWPATSDSSKYDERVRDIILKGAGVPDGWAGAIRYRRDERSAVFAILFANLAFGRSTDDDLFFIPDHGQQVVQTDHDGVIHVECADEGRMLDLVRHLEAAGYSLPIVPPDATFRWPRWMPQR